MNDPLNLAALAPVRVLLTGGTLDKVHDPYAEKLAFPPDGGSQAPLILERGRCAHPLIEAVLQKDSLDFDDADRKSIAEAARRAPEARLVVTHGTGTMGMTARFLATLDLGKTIVLTGALRPYSLSASDAAFNLGGAVIAAQTLPVGVWGVMNGRVIPAATLDKDIATGRFAP